MSTNSVAVSAKVVAPASFALAATGVSDAPSVKIDLTKPEGDSGNSWTVAVEFARDDTIVIADVEASILRITMSATVGDRTLGRVHEAVAALDHNSRGDPFNADVSYINAGTDDTEITQTAADLGGSFAGGSTTNSPPVDLITQGSLSVGSLYRLQAQSAGAMFITEQPTVDGSPDPSTIARFVLPPANQGEFLIEPETDKTIWVFATGFDGVIAVNG